jgi:hypothetical protein
VSLAVVWTSTAGGFVHVRPFRVDASTVPQPSRDRPATPRNRRDFGRGCRGSHLRDFQAGYSVGPYDGIARTCLSSAWQGLRREQNCTGTAWWAHRRHEVGFCYTSGGRLLLHLCMRFSLAVCLSSSRNPPTPFLELMVLIGWTWGWETRGGGRETGRERCTETPATRCINTRCIESPPNSVDCVV